MAGANGDLDVSPVDVPTLNAGLAGAISAGALISAVIPAGERLPGTGVSRVRGGGAAVNARLLRYSRYQVSEFIQHRLALPLGADGVRRGVADVRDDEEHAVRLDTRAAGDEPSRSRCLLSRSRCSCRSAQVCPLGWRDLTADRQQGYTFCFLFSKPVNVLAYYAQRTYVLHGLVFVAAFGAIVWRIRCCYTIHFLRPIARWKQRC